MGTINPMHDATKFIKWKTAVSDVLKLLTCIRFDIKPFSINCCSVHGLPDGVNPEKYNYTYSPCRPLVCNKTEETTAAVSEMLFCTL